MVGWLCCQTLLGAPVAVKLVRKGHRTNSTTYPNQLHDLSVPTPRPFRTNSTTFPNQLHDLLEITSSAETAKTDLYKAMMHI